MTTKTFLRRYWRVPLVAVLGALIAFGGSFLLQETYASSTRLLIRGRDTSFLTTSGQSLNEQPGLIDTGLAKSLAETYAGMATSREVSTMVVDELHLDQPKPEQTGPVAWMATTLATTYKCTRAFVTYGFCADADPRDKAIETVQGGLMAAQLGPESGAAAGQANSYVLELVGSGETPEEARDITNTAADALIQVGQNRARQDAQTYADGLGAQVEAADVVVDQAAQDVSTFQVEHGITDLDQQKVAAVNSAADTQSQLQQATDDLAGARAELASLDATLAGLDPSATTNEQITTGRSETGRSSTGPSSLYNEVSAERARAAAKVAELEGTQASLSARLEGGSPDAATLSTDQAALLQLEQKLTQAQDNSDRLTQQHQEALVNVQSTAVELTRIDVAAVTTYPVAPKKYLYLALGLLIGGLAGGGLTWLARRRDLADDEGADAAAPLAGGDEDGRELDLRAARAAASAADRVPVGAGAPAGASLFSRTPEPANGYGNGAGVTNGGAHGGSNGAPNGGTNGGYGNGRAHAGAGEGDVGPHPEGALETP